MARYSDPYGFSRPRPLRFGAQGLAFLTLILALAIAGCATPPQPKPLPYRFSIAGFTDIRPQDDDLMQNPYAFDESEFINSLHSQMPYTLFGSESAKLRLSLKHYAASSFMGSYALSMVVEMDGTDAWERPLAKRDVACSQVVKKGFELGDYADSMMKETTVQGMTHALTTEAREAKMWQLAFNQCVRELGEQFGQAVVAQQIRGKDND